MYENRKMRPVETIPGMDGVGMKESGRSEFNKEFNFCRCHNVPLVQQ
jgi:hypothetical protein